MRSAGFGWEINSANNNGANAFCKFLNSVTITGIQVDVSFMTLTPGNGFAEVLCTVSLASSRPIFDTTPQAYVTGPGMPQGDFGGFQIQQASTSEGVHGGGMGGGALASIILKTYCQNGGHDVRDVVITGLNIPVVAGNFIIFHMDHMGVSGDVEMQGVLFYQ